MRGTNDEFANQLAVFAAKATSRINTGISQVCLGVAASLVTKSPIGDPALWASPAPKNYVPGTFISNWRGNANSIDRTVEDIQDVSGETSMLNVERAIQEAYPLGGKIFYITNSLPYAQALEDGHSSQAPAGMVGLTVVEFRNIVSTAVRNAKAIVP